MFTIYDAQIKNMFLIMLGACVIALLAGNLFIYPTFTHTLIEQVEEEAVMVGNHMSILIFANDPALDNTGLQYNSQEFDETLKDFNIQKLKVFAADGKTIFSTDSKDIGVMNEHNYFRTQVARGNVFSRVVKKNTKTLEDQIMKVDVVETYVPVMRRNKFMGALEVYYEITDQLKTIRRSVLICNILSVGLIVLFLILGMFVARRLDENIAEKEHNRHFLRIVNLDLKEQIEQRLKAEQEKEQVIAELQQSLEKINVLSGLVPICSFCKNIRNDAGYWEQMEAYVEKYSEAQFSHGLCPACAAKHYPEVDLEDENSPDDQDPQQNG